MDSGITRSGKRYSSWGFVEEVNRCSGVAIQPGANITATSWEKSNRILIHDTNDKPVEKARIEMKSPRDVQFSRDGKMLWAIVDRNHLRAWETTNWKPSAGDWNNSIEHSASGNSTIGCFAIGFDQLFFGGHNGRLTQLSIQNEPKSVRRSQMLGDGFTSIACDESRPVVVAGTAGGELVLYHPDSDVTLQTLRQAHNGSILEIQLSRDGKLLATAGEDGLIKLWQMHEKSFEELLSLQSPNGAV